MSVVYTSEVQLLAARMAMSIHVKTKGKMLLCRNARPKDIKNLLGLKGRTAVELLAEIDEIIAALEKDKKNVPN